MVHRATVCNFILNFTLYLDKNMNAASVSELDPLTLNYLCGDFSLTAFLHAHEKVSLACSQTNTPTNLKKKNPCHRNMPCYQS